MGPLAGRFFDRGYLYVRFDQSGEEIIWQRFEKPPHDDCWDLAAFTIL